jgi:hypothetical protein
VVRELETGVGGPGPLDVIFDGRDDRGRALASGVYRIRLEAGELVRSASALLIK